MQTIYLRYHKATRKEKKGILDEFCKTHHYHRKHAIRFLNGPPPTDKEPATRLAKIHGAYCATSARGAPIGMATRRQISIAGAPLTRMLRFNT